MAIQPPEFHEISSAEVCFTHPLLHSVAFLIICDLLEMDMGRLILDVQRNMLNKTEMGKKKTNKRLKLCRTKLEDMF